MTIDNKSLSELWIDQAHRNRSFKLFMGVWEPFVNPCILTQEAGSPGCEMPGINYEIYTYILNQLHLGHTKLTVPSPQYGTRLSNGSYLGVLGDTLNGVYDGIVIYYYMSPQRIADGVPFSYPISFHSAGSLGYIVQRPSKHAALGNPRLLYKVMTPLMWEAFLTLFVLITIALFLALTVNNRVKVQSRVKNVGLSANKAIWEMVKMFLDEYDANRRSYSAESLATVTMAFFSLFFWTFYTASFLDTLLSGEFKAPFDSLSELADLIDHDGYRVVEHVGTSTIFFDEVRHSQLSTYKKMNHSLENHPAIVESDLTKIITMVESNSHLVFPGRTLLNGLLRGKCNLMFIKEQSSAPYSMGWVFTPGSPYMGPFSRILAGISPMIARVENKYIEAEEIRSRKDCPIETANAEPLRLIHFYGLAGICLVVYALAFVSLMIELSVMMSLKYYARNPEKRYSIYDDEGVDQEKLAELQLKCIAASTRSNSDDGVHWKRDRMKKVSVATI